MACRPFVFWASIAVVLLAGVAAAQTPAVKYAPPEQVRADFLKLVDRPRGDFKAEFASERVDDLTIDRGVILAESGSDELIPITIVRQTGRTGRLPVVICLHGTAGSRSDFDEIVPRLARRGYVAVAFDARYHGDRVPGGADGAEQYNEAIIAAWRAKAGEKQEHPYWYDTAYDLWRTIDYLVSLPTVDPDRIGAMGISMGGTEIMLAGAVDQRIKVSIPMIAVQSLRWSLENNRWHSRVATILAAHAVAAYDMGKSLIDPEVARALWNKVVPGALDKFDGPSLVRLFAPRPLFIVNSELDDNCPLPGAQIAFDQAQAAYASAGAADHLNIYVAPGLQHQVTGNEIRMADDWLDRWLKP